MQSKAEENRLFLHEAKRNRLVQFKKFEEIVAIVLTLSMYLSSHYSCRLLKEWSEFIVKDAFL